MSKSETKKGAESSVRETSTREKDTLAAEQATPKKQNAQTDRGYDKERLEVLLDKGLDLVETGVDLGVKVVTRLGSILKDQVIDKVVINEGRPAQPAAAPAPPGTQQGADEEAYHLRNRTTIIVGNPFSLSFSINNESSETEKKIRVSTEAFVGDAHQVVINADAFNVTPAEKSIAPMDFDKFVLKGAIPKDVPEDNYRGVIVVMGEEQYRIPVILTVTRSLDR